MGVKIFNPKRLNIPTQFKDFVKKVTRHPIKLKNMINSNKLLNKAVNSVFNKKLFKRAGIATVAGLGIHYITEYIKNNSGCFLNESSKIKCKVQTFSCCEPNVVKDIPICSNNSLKLKNPCHGFDEEKEGSCCRMCSCDHFDCAPGQKLECKRADVAEALTHFAQATTSGIWSGITSVFPTLNYIVYVVGGLFLLWICLRVSKLFRKQDD
jgi:hypothetical protein